MSEIRGGLVGYAHPEEIRTRARCADPSGQLTSLFFSEDIPEIRRAKAICRGCEVRIVCLQGAQERREPCGVWGGELFVNGRILAVKRPRGRPPKHGEQLTA
ncbi:MAG: WhiB family transcriptional regulator [Acidimicrobiia bacterium]|nr:WhiB family transcriptional regulator [Acidimicrobiia bacterium]